MEKFRTKKMSVKLDCVCMNKEYFDVHYFEYYVFLNMQICYSKVHGTYFKSFYKLKSLVYILSLGLDKSKYYELPHFVCASKIY